MAITPITRQIAWHPGGAQRDSNGESVKWPWGDKLVSPVVRYRFSHEGYINCARIQKTAWWNVSEYHDPADLEPPKWE